MTVALVVAPVFGLKIEMVLPQMGLVLGFGPLFIFATERATMAWPSLFVLPHEPRPVL